ncbi:hypothetical protein M3A49_30840 [Paraburkholderia sp. CNPSo 3076]|uniref:hypothetical protein n=1 Tax=Paraburkholderia sp. CNPSo 3076 TaxID=2940936 RepID=UPI00224D4B1F|nr:hypothetical protein [Paraburkholderia sp. CNPSo 3076]MCX5543830.1 hypothetical protein [Paraburkholderia sp. CNPSo 3076]
MTLGAAANLRNISGTLGAARRQLAMTQAKGTCRFSHAFHEARRPKYRDGADVKPRDVAPEKGER